MWMLMVEAGVALFLLVFIVWWTMYSGQKPTDHQQPQLPRTDGDTGNPPDTPRDS